MKMTNFEKQVIKWIKQKLVFWLLISILAVAGLVIIGLVMPYYKWQKLIGYAFVFTLMVISSYYRERIEDG